MRRSGLALLALATMCGCQFAFSTIGSWTVKTPPPQPITTNNIVTLGDGRVAIFGGLMLQTGQASNQTVLYDPARDSWTTGAPMPGPVLPDVVAPLRDGTVLVEGGQDTRTNSMSGATWLYDPARNSWRRAGDLLEPRGGPGFTVLGDGRVLIAGGSVPLAQPVQLPDGSESNFENVTSAEIFDPQTLAWSQAGRLGTGRGLFALVPLPGGGALAAGGCTTSSVFPNPGLSAAEVFDPVALSWRPTTSMPIPICGATALGLRDGRALLVDQSPIANSTSDAYVYDPRTRRWSGAGGLAGGGSTAVMLSDGRVLVPEVQPGLPSGRLFMDNVGGQIFDPATNQWTYTTTTSVPLSIVYLYAGGTSLAVPLPDGRAVVLLQTVALAFDPQVAPPPTQLLDSTGTTIVLLAIAAVIGLLMLLAYRRAGRNETGKLA